MKIIIKLFTFLILLSSLRAADINPDNRPFHIPTNKNGKWVSSENFKPSPTACIESVSANDLLDWIQSNIIQSINDPDHTKTMPRTRTSEADDYDDPTPSQLTLWEDLIIDLSTGDADGACIKAGDLGYKLIDFTETGTGEQYYILRTIPYDATENPDPHFWGTYIMNQQPRRRNLFIQSPHPLKDLNTGRQGIEVFRLTGAWFFMMAGTSRCNLTCDLTASETPPQGSNCTSCSGSTTVCSEESRRYPISDMAHNENSAFQKTTEVLGAYPGYFVQLHGFGQDPGDPYAVLSNGTDQHPTTGTYDPLPALEEQLRDACGLLPEPTNSICVVHIDLPPSGTTCSNLKGFNNVQGRHLNDDVSPCEAGENLTPTSWFIHMEQAYENFREFRSDYGNVAQAIANTFDFSEFQMASITNTSNLGVNHFEPMTYGYDFLAPIESELLCKNSHLSSIPVASQSGPVVSGTYEDIDGTITSSGTIANTERVWLLGEESIVLTDGFEAKSEDFFSAELMRELDFCETPNLYEPDSYTNRFFTSIYGPRMTSRRDTITRTYDFHRGEDIVDKKTPSGGDPLPNIICMCEGEVDVISSGGDEGKSVIVKCDATFNQNATLGNIYIAYRHLNDYAPGLVVGQRIRKGDLIGPMGGTGAGSSSPHLHMSVLKKTGSNFINLHPMRIFNNALNQHLNLPIDEPPTGTAEEQKQRRVNIFLLDYSNTSTDPEENWAIFRVAVPYNKAAIRAILIRNGGYSEKADFEEISEVRDGNATWLDDPEVGQLKLFPIPFLRGGSSAFSAHGRYESIKVDLCDGENFDICDHPANFYPVPDEGIFKTPAYVLDIKAKGLDQYFDPLDFEVDVLDIWGNGMRGAFQPTTPPPSNLTVPGYQQALNGQSPVVAIAEGQEFNLQVYPNPNATGRLTFQLSGPLDQIDHAILSILDFTGKEIFRREMTSTPESRFDLNIRDLVAGAYIIRLNLDGNLISQTLVRH